MSKVTIIHELPRVGDKLMRIMVKSSMYSEDNYNPEPCVVTYVNEAHNWYEVEFTDSGLKECYNFPVFDHAFLKGLSRRFTPILCINTGDVYSDAEECAEELGLYYKNISKQLKKNQGCTSYGGYTFITVI